MDLEIVATAVFLLTYSGIALGSVPGLALDRTGMALLGAISMLITGALGESEAFRAINLPTILLLYSLMVLSAQFTLGGFYTRAALRITKHLARPEVFLASLILSSAFLSAVLANDVVCLAFTPVICVVAARAALNPIPFVLALACSSNIGSAATIMGNPQNMLIGQVGRLEFGKFMLWCLPPSLISLGALYGILVFLYRGKWRVKPGGGKPPAPDRWPGYDTHQSTKAVLLAATLIVLFFTPIPREFSSLTIAGIILCSRKMSTRSILGLVDWHLITLFCALFIVVGGFAKYGIPQVGVHLLLERGYDLNAPLVLSTITLVLSNMVSNVPAVMLLLKNIDLARTENLYLLALVSTYAGNLLIIGSIANLITIEQARAHNIHLGFRAHARVGVPITFISIFAALAWVSLFQ